MVALTLPIYLSWAYNQAEQQIDRMQAEAFNTPGVQGPINSPIALLGLALFAIYMIVCRLLGLRRGQAAIAIVAGTSAGIGAFWWRSEQEQ